MFEYCYLRLSATAMEAMVEALQTTDLRDKFVFPTGVINRTAEWLVTQQDPSTGIFREAGNVQFRHFYVCIPKLCVSQIMFT